MGERSRKVRRGALVAVGSALARIDKVKAGARPLITCTMVTQRLIIKLCNHYDLHASPEQPLAASIRYSCPLVLSRHESELLVGLLFHPACNIPGQQQSLVQSQHLVNKYGRNIGIRGDVALREKIILLAIDSTKRFEESDYRAAFNLASSPYHLRLRMTIT
jgi:hypothetical protein